MAQNSFALMTNLGRAKEAAALANGTAIVITHIAIGDGATVPSGGETSLYNEVARKAISGHGTVVGAANTAYFDIFLAAADGPYTIREAGIYDSAGDLIAIARYDPPISKPVPSSGQTVEGTVRLQIAFSNIANVTIVVDPAFTVPLQRLSRLPWIPVLSMSITAPPSSPALGDAYLIPVGAIGSWAGQSGKVAEYTAAGWAIINTPNGHGISLPDGRIFENVGGTYIEKVALDAQSGKWNYATAGGTANALTATLVPAPVSSASMTGMPLRLKISVANTGPATLKILNDALPITTIRGEALKAGDLALGNIVNLVCTGVSWAVMGITYGEVSVNVPNPTVYVRTDGNDANDGSANTAQKAMKTIQAAISRGMGLFNVAGRDLTIQLGNPGTYAAPANIPASGGRIVISGDFSNQTAYIVSGAGNPGGGVILANPGVRIYCTGITTHNTGTTSHNISATGGGSILYENSGFTNTAVGPMSLAAAFGGGAITLGEGVYINAWAASALLASAGFININQVNVNVANNVTFSDAFAVAQAGGAIQASVGASISANGTVGPRYRAALNGVIYIFGAGPNFFPGSSAGTVTSGGQYA